MRAWFLRLDRAELLAIFLVGAFLFVGTALPLAISFGVSPEDIESGRVHLSGPCPYQAEHGSPCASCGLTRGFAALSRGRVADALGYNTNAAYVYGAFWLVALASGLAMTASGVRSRRAARAP